MLLPLFAPSWLVVLSIALLWIDVLPVQQHSPPLHPFALSMPPQNDAL